MEVQPEDLAGALRCGYAFCSQDADEIVAAVNKVQQLELQNSERNVDILKLKGDLERLQDDYKAMVKDRDGWQETVSRDIRWQDQLINQRDAALRLVGELQNAMVQIVGVCQGSMGDEASFNAIYDIAKGLMENGKVLLCLTCGTGHSKEVKCPDKRNCETGPCGEGK